MKLAKKLLALNLALILSLSLLPLQAHAASVGLSLGSAVSFEEPSKDGYTFNPTTAGIYTVTISRTKRDSSRVTTPASCGSLVVYGEFGTEVAGMEHRGVDWSVYSYSVPMEAGKTYTIAPGGGSLYDDKYTCNYSLSVSKENISNLSIGARTSFRISSRAHGSIPGYHTYYYQRYDPHYFAFTPSQSGWYTFTVNSSDRAGRIGELTIYDSSFGSGAMDSYHFWSVVRVGYGSSTYLQGGQTYYLEFEANELSSDKKYDVSGTYTITASRSKFPAITTSTSQTVFNPSWIEKTYVTFTPDKSGSYTITARSDGDWISEMDIYSDTGDRLASGTEAGYSEMSALGGMTECSEMNATLDLAGGTTYYIGLLGVRDYEEGGNTISVSVSYNGGTGTALITGLSPANGAKDVDSDDTKFLITFDREIASGEQKLLAKVNFDVPGAIKIYRAADDKLIYPDPETQHSYSQYDYHLVYNQENVLSISPINRHTLLEPGTEYYITMGEGFITFADGSTNQAIKKGEWVFKTEWEHFSTESIITIRTGDSDKEKAKVSAKWRDDWFTDSTIIYNHEMARTLMALSGAAYYEDCIENALSVFNFKNIKTYNYDYAHTETDNDVVAYAFGVKEVKAVTERPTYLIAVTVKGTSANEEWYSNFNVGHGETHAGFNIASEKLMASLREYVQSARTKLNIPDGAVIKYMVTGHSRGAAVANLVAAKLTDSATSKNVYAYTFATPTVSTKATKAGYENIFNIISGEDFVTQVPLAKWNYKHYGVDLSLPSRSYYASGKYDVISAKMDDEYYFLTEKPFEFYKKGTQDVDEVLLGVFYLAPSIYTFYYRNHILATEIFSYKYATTSGYFRFVASALINGGTGEGVIHLVGSLSGDFLPITDFFVKNHVFNKRILSAHSPAAYYSWLSQCTEEELFGKLNSSTWKTFSRLIVRCPVDVYVYDENGTLVASVVNEAVDENILAVGVEDGVKTIDLPSDQNYSIRVVATGEGDVTYTVEERVADGMSDEILRTVTFNPIDIVAGDELTGTVSNVWDTDSDNYALTKNGEDVIYPESDTLNPAPSTPSVPTNPSYPIKVADAANGAVTVTPTSAEFGSSITITAVPDADYTTGKVTVTDLNGKSVSVTDNGDGTYTFTMPASLATVSVTFERINRFTDVSKGSWYYDAVDYVARKDLMRGTSTTIFEPNTATTRAMIVTILYRMEKSPAAGNASFDDVNAGTWYTDAVAWASASGIVKGYGNGKFGPGDPITREQVAAILYRYAEYKGYDISGQADLTGYTDAKDVSGWALTAMRWANDAGLITGRTAATLAPDGTTNRAEAAAILMRFCQKVAGLE